MQRMVVTGASGYLGGYVVEVADQAGWDVVAPSSAQLDVRDVGGVETFVARTGPAAVLHLAYRKPDAATIVGGSAAVASAARRAGARLVHVSTDAVFGGRPEPYVETDPVDPIEPYGAAKAEAERGVASLHPDAVLVRTSLLYGTERLSPVQQDVVRALDGAPLAFFTDEVRAPVHAADLAAALVALAGRPEVTGPLHVAGPDPVDRLEFARGTARSLGRDPGGLRGTTIAASGLTRPARVVLDSSRARALGFTSRGWSL